MCLGVRIYIFVQMLVEARGIGSLGHEVTGGCELSDVDIGSQIQVLTRSAFTINHRIIF